MSSVCPSVCLSVCPSVPSVTLVDHAGPHRLEILETNCTNNSRNTFALRSPKVIHLIPGEHGEILGRLEVGWEKVACWNTKAAISLKRAKIEEKLLRRAYGKSSTLFRTVPFPTLYAPPFPRSGFATSAQNSNPIISGKCKAVDFKFGQYIHRVHPNKSPLKFWRKGSLGVCRDCPIFFGGGTPY